MIEPKELLGIGYPGGQPTDEFPELPDPSKNQLPVGLLGEESEAYPGSPAKDGL